MFRSRTKVTPLDLSKLKKRKDCPSPNQSDEQDASISRSSSPASSASSQGSSDYTLFTTPSPSESEETRFPPPVRALLRNSRVYRLSMSKTRGELSPIVISESEPSPTRIYNKNKILPPTPEDIALSESGFQYPLTFWDLEQWDSSLNVDDTDNDPDDPDSPSSMRFTIGVNLDPDDDEGGQQFYIIHHKEGRRSSCQTAPVDTDADPDTLAYGKDGDGDDDDDDDRQFLFEVLKRSGQLWLDTNRASLLIFRLPLPDAETGEMCSGQRLDQDRAASPSPSPIPNPSPSPRLSRPDPKRQNRSGGLFVWSPVEGSYVQVKTPDCSDTNLKCKHDADREMSE